ncbi:hypothetical protein AGMMS49925_07950 [Deltaproteobacteria bacterium]|nr:hypothetical protein AGMMS49925_07950 [Deltaproteobacteria bacterium]
MLQKYRLVTSLFETLRLGGARPDNCIIDPEARRPRGLFMSILAAAGILPRDQAEKALNELVVALS